ncbi:MAG TPA: PAS domain S-box protein [Deltaproteobacteria bacterium]|nr:PAS domain S-box protein [Deltaproteobacteria bacterium]
MATTDAASQTKAIELKKEFDAYRHADERFANNFDKYLEFIDFLPDATFIIDRNSRVIAWNRAMEKMTGVKKDDIIGKGEYEHAMPFYNRRRPMLVDLICTENSEAELLYNFTQRDGDTLYGEAYVSSVFGNREAFLWAKASPLYDKDGNLVGAIESIRDITERRNKEQALQESEERYRTLTENVADGVALIQKGKLLFVNNAFVTIFGYTDAEDIVGRTAVDLIRSDCQHDFEMLLAALESGGVSNNTFQGLSLSKDRREFWIEAQNNMIRWNGETAVLSTIRDITETKMKALAFEEESHRLRGENIRLKASMRYRWRLGPLIGKSAVMQEVYERIHQAAASDANVIIYGESGTGKELIARAIHEMGDRRENAFVPVNCGAIPEHLLESEFFGHKKGAFTGAYSDKHGYLDLADNGSLFLDEIGELGMNIQVKLLRALEGGSYSPLGSAEVRHSTIRIVAATNRNLINQVNMGLMREDFFYRIHVIPISLPPLRNRREDIPLLVEHFMKNHNTGTATQHIPGNIMDALFEYDWPGNVRELQNVLHRYVTLKSIDFTSPHSPAISLEKEQTDRKYDPITTLSSAMEQFEKKILVKTLKETKWHKTKAASALGISRKTLFRKMKAYALI